MDELFFGIEVVQVQQAPGSQKMTRVPLAPEVIEGLIKLRGQIVTAIDMRRRLKLRSRPEDALPMGMVVHTADGAVSLLVDETGDVLEVDQDCIERPPENLEGVGRQLIRGVYNLKDRLLLVLDTERTVDVGHGRDEGLEADRQGRFSERGRAEPFSGAHRGLIQGLNEILEGRQQSAEYAGLVAAIPGSRAMIEFHFDGAIVGANENFLTTVGYTLEEIEGRHHDMFVEEAYGHSTE